MHDLCTNTLMTYALTWTIQAVMSVSRLSHSDIDNDYSLDGYSLFRNDEVDKNEK